MKTTHVDPDSMVQIDDFSTATLGALAERLHASKRTEQLIYRESELDELWRLVEAELAAARRAPGRAGEIERLEALSALAWEVHDLVGVDEDAPAAARRLREALLLVH